MNGLADPFKQLMERRLWPVALLLVAALAAIPFVLVKKDAGTDVVPAATAALPAGAENPSESLVSASDADKRDSVRSVLGTRKDPFRPAQVRRVPKEPTLDTTAALGAKADTGVKAGGALGTDPGKLPTVDATSTPTPEPKTYELHSLIVRVGDPSGELRTRNLERLSGLPGGTNPALLYLGLRADNKTAVFIVDAGASVIGDGKCLPAADDCQTLELKVGDTEFINRGEDKSYEVDLVKIFTETTTDARVAKVARTAVASGGRRALRKRLDRVGPYRYSTRTGTLKKVKRHRSARTAKTVATPEAETYSSSG